MLLFIALFLFWVILNGKITLEIGIFGIVLSAAVTWFARRHLGYGETKGRSLKFYGLYGLYLLILLIEIVKANICVVKLVWRNHVDLEPLLVTFTPALETDFSKVMLANSITLTPGTITVDENNGEFKVHCLDASLAEGIEDSVFVRMLKRMEAA